MSRLVLNPISITGVLEKKDNEVTKVDELPQKEEKVVVKVVEPQKRIKQRHSMIAIHRWYRFFLV
jgi:hypothetical protein